MLRPDEIVSPTPAWAFTFELSPPGSPLGASSITTRANNQFPWPDFHRLDKQPYRLQTKYTKFGKNFIDFLCFVVFVSSFENVAKRSFAQFEATTFNSVIPAWRAGIQVDMDVL